MSFEIHRCFDVHEVIPDLDVADVTDRICELAQGLLDKAIIDGVTWPNGVIPKATDRYAMGFHLDRMLKMGGVFPAIARVLTTPRSFKYYQRNIRRSWELTRGELDLYELMALEAIRTAYPAHYGDILPRICDLIDCSRSRNHISENRKKENDEEIRANIEAIKSLGLSNSSSGSISSLLDLVDGLRLGTFSVEGRVQSAANPDHGSVYLARLTSSYTNSGPTSDQSVLAHIKDYLHDGNSKNVVAGITQTDGYSKVFDRFSHWLATDWEKLALLYADLVDADLASIRQTGKYEEGKSYIQLWRIWLHDNCVWGNADDSELSEFHQLIDGPRLIKRLKDGGQTLPWVSGLIFRALQVSIAEANSLYYYHSGKPSGSAFLPERQVAQLRKAIHEHIKENGQNSEWWLSRLQPGQPFALFHLFYHVAGKDQPPILNKPENWRWAIPPILQACETRWQLIAPMLLFLISESTRDVSPDNPTGSGYRFSETLANEWCDNDPTTLRALLSTVTAHTADSIDLPPREKLGCLEISRGASAFISSMQQ